MIIDKEIIDNFKEETNTLLEGLNEILDELEDTEEEFPEHLVENFCQQIDRIMGTAATISMMAPDHPSLPVITKLTELCKKMGYNAVAAKKANVVTLFTAFWADVTEVLEKLTENFGDIEKSKTIIEKDTQFLKKRLEWLYAKIPKLVYDKDKAQEEASTKKESKDSAGNFDQSQVDDFLKNLLK